MKINLYIITKFNTCLFQYNWFGVLIIGTNESTNVNVYLKMSSECYFNVCSLPSIAFAVTSPYHLPMSVVTYEINFKN